MILIGLCYKMIDSFNWFCSWNQIWNEETGAGTFWIWNKMGIHWKAVGEEGRWKANFVVWHNRNRELNTAFVRQLHEVFFYSFPTITLNILISWEKLFPLMRIITQKSVNNFDCSLRQINASTLHTLHAWCHKMVAELYLMELLYKLN